MNLASKIRSAVLEAIKHDGAIAESGIRQRDQKVFEINGNQTALKSMLEPSEIALLHVLARDFYQGQGHIIDAGCLFGISTHALASGIRQNVDLDPPELPIQSFDLFEVNPPYDAFAANFHTFGPTSNALHTFLKFNARNLDLVSPHQGDFLQWKWAKDAPIEIIFNDLSKNVDLNNHMFRQCISRLIPGEGILIQQDYVHFAEWWIAAAMELFRDEFEELGYYYGATKLYRLKAESKVDFASFDLRDLSHNTIENLLTEAIARAPVTVKEALTAALGMFFIDTDKYDRALQTVLPMKLGEAEMEVLLAADVPPHENFARVLPSNRRAVIQYARNQTQTFGPKF